MLTITEERVDWKLPAFVHPGYRDRFPWLVHGVTGRGEGPEGFDLAFFGSDGGGASTWDRWAVLARQTGCQRIVHAAQLHGTAVRVHDAGPPGVHLSWEADGHVTAGPGVLLTVSVADCVPVFLVHRDRRAVGLVHAGWRGMAGGILARTIETLRTRLDVRARDLFFHAGPSICGRCYEVGPEVHEALGLEAPRSPAPVDLRGVLVREAVGLGIEEGRISVSGHCTLCGPSLFYSHRGGDGGRQVAFVGIRRRRDPS